MQELKPFQATRDLSLHASLKNDGFFIDIGFALQDLKNLVEWNAPAIKAERRQELWKDTCFELFFSPSGSTNYWELNVSTQGHWNLFRFDSYRSPGYPNLSEETLVQQIDIETKKNKIHIRLPIKVLGLEKSPLDVSIAAILKLKNGETSYWALTHLKEKPDFHIRESFILKLGSESSLGK